QKALTLDPGDCGTLERLSTLLLRERDFSGAEQATSTLLGRTPDKEGKLRLTLRLSQIYADGFGDLDRAATACRDALALDPYDLEAAQRLAQVLGRQKDWKTL